DFEDDPVPSARFLLALVRHGPRTRTLRPAQPEGEAPVRDGGEGLPPFDLHLEAQVLRVELHRLVHVLDLISDRPGPEVLLLVLALVLVLAFVRVLALALVRVLVLVVGLGRRWWGRLFVRPAPHRQQPNTEEYRDKPARHGFPLGVSSTGSCGTT